MKRAESLESLSEELGEAKEIIERMKKQRRICKWMSIILWMLIILGLLLLILIRVSFVLEWRIFTNSLILAEILVQQQNVSGFEVSVWATVKGNRTKIENKTIGFWRWLDNLHDKKNDYYMVRKPKVKLKSTVKIKHWHSSDIEVYEENSFIQKQEGNRTIKYFIGSTYRTSENEELGGCWIFRSAKDFNPWTIRQCKYKGTVKRSKRDKNMDKIKSAAGIRENVEKWIETNGMLFKEGNFIVLTTVRDRSVGSRKTGYAELEITSETRISLELNKTVPWIWKRRLALPRVKFNFKIGYWEIDEVKWETDVYLIQMEIKETLQTEIEIKNYYEDKVKQIEQCVRKEMGKKYHGQKYKYIKTDSVDFSYAHFCDKDEENMDCDDFCNGTDPITGNKTNENLSIKRRLYLKRLNLNRRKDKEGIYRNNLVFFSDAVFGLLGNECGSIIEKCSSGHDQITINQIASVLCYWSKGIVPLPWTFKRSKLANKYEMTYGTGGVIRIVSRNPQWKMFYGPVYYATNSMLRYRVPKGGKNVPLTKLDAIAIDDLSLTIERRNWKENWCKAKDKNYYLGLDWLRNDLCNTSIEIKGQKIKGGPRWFEDPGEFVKKGVEGVKKAAETVFNFVTTDLWSSLINLFIRAGWYILYGGLIVLGLVIIMVIIKCFCASLGQRMMSRKDNGDVLTVLGKLIDFQDKGHKRIKRTKKHDLEKPLL
ncbi:uncharacterized protein LOC113084981 [Carassius auratus]|uniref:Uncharacterized protein LOC113084981 n=1 Tax=Carassius auratus TaxID=7957 RepID=A0A6P6NR27_CARAU|nr:uncharacterized protein LOC113084981 [Carassius auratus]